MSPVSREFGSYHSNEGLEEIKEISYQGSMIGSLHGKEDHND